MPSAALLRTIESADAQQLDALGAKFCADIAAGKHEDEGWPSSMCVLLCGPVEPHAPDWLLGIFIAYS